MATYTRVSLSGATTDLPIVVAATAVSGTLIHTAISGTVNYDEIYLWANNTSTAPATLNIQWGGATDPDHTVVNDYSIPSNSPLIPIVPGLIMRGGLVIRAWSGTANVINITGYVNRSS